jgi:hypothetical protein
MPGTAGQAHSSNLPRLVLRGLLSMLDRTEQERRRIQEGMGEPTIPSPRDAVRVLRYRKSSL